MVACIRDLFVAGTDSTSTTLSWLILGILNYPDHYKTIQNEIDSNIGENNVYILRNIIKVLNVKKFLLFILDKKAELPACIRIIVLFKFSQLLKILSPRSFSYCVN